MYLLFLFSVILNEALTELCVKSQILYPLRKFLSSKSSFLEKLLSCGYCFSVWSAILVNLVVDCTALVPGPYLLQLAVLILVTHRLSNYLHNFNDKHLDKYYSNFHSSSEKE